MMWMLLLSAIMNFSAYWHSDKWVLKLYRAEQVDKYSSPKLHALVVDVSRRAGLPEPKIYVIQQPTPNAFATGRNPENAAVAVTSGLLQLLNKYELQGVIAHEVSHIKNRDTLTMTIAATMAGTIGYLSHIAFWFGGSRRQSNSERGVGILGAILGPIVASMVQMTISRTREFEADRTAAEILQDGRGLIAALEKLEAYSVRDFAIAQSNPATAHLFIVNPLKNISFSNLFATHPSTQERIEHLKSIKFN